MKLKIGFMMVMVSVFGLGQYSYAQENSTKKDSLQNAYFESQAFKQQIAKTQVITGGVLMSGGVGMVISGIVKKANYQPPTDAEGVEIPNAGTRGPGVGLIVAGGLSSVAGAILFKRGFSAIKQFKNKQGEVTSELNLSPSGTGLSFKF